MHFSLAVFHYHDENVDSLLAPFNENAEVEKYVAYTRQEAIDYARAHFPSCRGASDEECWNAMADDAEETDENGNIYSTCNTDGHWDWYEIGGRWSGLLKVGNEYVNSARVKDIDFGSEPFSTFAVLFPDGEWYEHEPVLVSECDWTAHYREQFIDMADPNMILTIVDCHI